MAAKYLCNVDHLLHLQVNTERVTKKLAFTLAATAVTKPASRMVLPPLPIGHTAKKSNDDVACDELTSKGQGLKGRYSVGCCAWHIRGLNTCALQTTTSTLFQGK